MCAASFSDVPARGTLHPGVPSVAQLAALTAVPSGLVRPIARQMKTQVLIDKNGKKQYSRVLVDLGVSKAIGRIYNPQASRPFPSLTSPEQSIVVTMELNIVGFTTSTIAAVYYGVQFSLNSFVNYTEYTALFDQYRFDEIEAWIEPSTVMSSSVGGTSYYTAVDLDDGNTPTTSGDVSAKQGALCSDTGTGHYHRWQPHMAVAAYSGAFTSYSNVPAGFIDCASPGVQHYGLKAATSAADGLVRAMDLIVRAKITFRGPGI
jgi:hypothetical protein